MAAVDELGYEPDFLAQSLRRGATLSVGFVVGDISNPLIADIACGAESELRRAGYSMLVDELGERPAHGCGPRAVLREPAGGRADPLARQRAGARDAGGARERRPAVRPRSTASFRPDSGSARSATTTGTAPGMRRTRSSTSGIAGSPWSRARWRSARPGADRRAARGSGRARHRRRDDHHGGIALRGVRRDGDGEPPGIVRPAHRDHRGRQPAAGRLPARARPPRAAAGPRHLADHLRRRAPRRAVRPADLRRSPGTRSGSVARRQSCCSGTSGATRTRGP